MTRGAAPALALLGALGLTGCIHARDFRAPGSRITEHTAHTEYARARVDVELLEPDAETLVINAGVGVTAVRGRLAFGLNLAHGAVGIVSAQSKFTFVARHRYALGGRVAFSYLNPQTLWALPPSLRDEFGAVHVLSAPFELWNTVVVTPWLDLNLGLSYRGAWLWGQVDVEGLVANANIGRRRLALEPYANLYIAQRLALIVGAKLPVLTQSLVAAEASFELSPDLLVGVESLEWQPQSFANSYQLQAALETRFGRNTYFRLGVHVFGLRPLPVLTVSPSLSLYWRFG